MAQVDTTQANKVKQSIHSREEKRQKNFNLLEIIQDWLLEKGVQAGLEFAANFHCTCKCQRIAYRKQDVDVAGRESSDQAQNSQCWYENLIRCKSVWSCPSCSAKIQQKNREDACKAIEWAYENNYKVVMVTFTFAHYRWQTCEDLLGALSRALAYLRSGREWQSIKEEWEFQGLIRGLEINLGSNGWHPHTHELWIVSKNFDCSHAVKIITDRWTKAAVREDVVGDEVFFRQHSVNIRDNISSSDYIAKFAEVDSTRKAGDFEVASHQRKSFKAGMSPFEIVERFASDSTSDSEKKYLKDSFIEYSLAVRGKACIYWSTGLKKKVGINEKEDAFDDEQKQEDKKIVFRISKEEWKLVLKHKARAKILEFCEKKDYMGARAFIYSLRE